MRRRADLHPWRERARVPLDAAADEHADPAQFPACASGASGPTVAPLGVAGGAASVLLESCASWARASVAQHDTAVAAPSTDTRIVNPASVVRTRGSSFSWKRTFRPRASHGNPGRVVRTGRRAGRPPHQARRRLLRGRSGGGRLLPLAPLFPVLSDLHLLAAVLAPAAGHRCSLFDLGAPPPTRRGSGRHPPPAPGGRWRGGASRRRTLGLSPSRPEAAWGRECPPRPGPRWGAPRPP